MTLILWKCLDRRACLRRNSRVEVARDRPGAVSITVTPRVALLAARGGAPGVQLVDAPGVAFERADRAPCGALPATVAPGATRPQEAAVTVLDAVPTQRRARLRGIAVATDGSVDLRFGTVVAGGGAPAATVSHRRCRMPSSTPRGSPGTTRPHPVARSLAPRSESMPKLDIETRLA